MAEEVKAVAQWVPILSAPVEGETPYNWDSKWRGQCAWGTYYRILKNGWPDPCYHDRSRKAPGFTNAKEWLANFREPWVPIYVSKNPDYIPTPGDVIVFDGTYGHVAVIELQKSNDIYLVSDWNRAAKGTYAIIEWKRGTNMPGTGPVLGYLHYPGSHNHVTPVAEDSTVDQIYATDGTLRVRLAPNLKGTYYCNITPGYYNILSKTAATAEDKISESGLTMWYEIESGKYCANITTVFKPAKGSEDIVRLLQQLIDEFEAVRNENTQLKERIAKAVKILEGDDD